MLAKTESSMFSLLQRMPQIEHNAPKFKYRIYYKLDEPGKTWNIEDIADWKQKEFYELARRRLRPARPVRSYSS